MTSPNAPARTLAVVAVVAVVVVAATAALLAGRRLAQPEAPAAAHGLDGKWEVTVSMDLVPVPGQATGPWTDTQCLDEAPPRAHLPPNCRAQPPREPRPEDQGHITWHIHCAMPRQGDGDLDLVRTGDTFDGTLRMWLQDAQTGAARRLTQKLHGRRLGPCE